MFFFKSDGIIPFAHAIWHVFVALAAAVHYYAIWKYLYKAPSADTLLQSWPQPGLDAGSPPSSSSSCAPERRRPAHRLPQLPAEAATTAKKFTKTLTVNCLLFSNDGEQIFSDQQKLLSKSCFVQLQWGREFRLFSNEPWPVHECLRNLIAVFCITWIESHSTSPVILCFKTWRFHPFQLVGDVEWGA